MTVKQCAQELGLTRKLVREMLACDLLKGTKEQGHWVICNPSVEALKNSVEILRAAVPSEHEWGCWSWLYEDQ
jgi:hypothetical protein